MKLSPVYILLLTVAVSGVATGCAKNPYGSIAVTEVSGDLQSLPELHTYATNPAADRAHINIRATQNAIADDLFKSPQDCSLTSTVGFSCNEGDVEMHVTLCKVGDSSCAALANGDYDLSAASVKQPLSAFTIAVCRAGAWVNYSLPATGRNGTLSIIDSGAASNDRVFSLFFNHVDLLTGSPGSNTGTVPATSASPTPSSSSPSMITLTGKFKDMTVNGDVTCIAGTASN